MKCKQCFLAGANSIFVGDELLTTDNPGRDNDAQLMSKLGIEPLPAFEEPALDKAPTNTFYNPASVRSGHNLVSTLELYRGARLASILCNVRRCIFNRRAVSETFRSQSSYTR